jgi:hypothetical protein
LQFIENGFFCQAADMLKKYKDINLYAQNKRGANILGTIKGGANLWAKRTGGEFEDSYALEPIKEIFDNIEDGEYINLCEQRRTEEAEIKAGYDSGDEGLGALDEVNQNKSFTARVSYKETNTDTLPVTVTGPATDLTLMMGAAKKRRARSKHRKTPRRKSLKRRRVQSRWF